MKTRSIVASAIIALSLAGLAAPGVASASLLSSRLVSQQQLDKLHAGESLREVVSNLGKPNNITKWADGSRSAVYDTGDSQVGPQKVYIDLDAQDRVVTVEVLAL